MLDVGLFILTQNIIPAWLTHSIPYIAMGEPTKVETIKRTFTFCCYLLCYYYVHLNFLRNVVKGYNTKNLQ